MNSNILADIKKMLGIEENSNEFNIDILSSINSAFFVLYQLGICLDEPFYVTNSTTWDDLTTTAPKVVIRDYIYLKVRLTFDPPGTSFVLDALKDRISELEFRLNIHVDNGGGEIYG